MQQNWFTVESIDEMTYAISEYGHWEKVHSYLVIGKACACLIDTGIGIGRIKPVTDRLTRLPIKVLTTHVHWDHIGGHGEFAEIYVHQDDAGWLRNGIPLPADAVRKLVLQEPPTQPLPDGFRIDQYTPFRGEPTGELVDGQLIDLGGRSLEIIHTPGHSPGHICLYEREQGYLFTGDLLYRGTLFAFYPSTDPVLFANSIERLTDLTGVQKLLPAHNELHIPLELLNRVHRGFQELKAGGKLLHGSGLHSFGDVNVRL